MTEIDLEFRECLWEICKKYQPRRIVETGLYHGIGSTRILANYIREFCGGVNAFNSRFYSIEVNPVFIQIAEGNLGREGLSSNVLIVEGLSIPRSLLPNLGELKNLILEASSNGKKVDHEGSLEEMCALYSFESSQFKEDDRLGYVLEELKNEVDLILLDSGGHLGNIEFDYVVSKLNSPCLIALDDVNHLKHFKSYEAMKKDQRFEILAQGDSKFGYVIAKFKP